MFEEMKLHRFLSTKIMTTIIRLSLIGMIVASFVGVGILSAPENEHRDHWCGKHWRQSNSAFPWARS